MPPRYKFEKVVLISDQETRELARNTHNKLVKYARIQHQPLHEGLRAFNERDLKIQVQKNGEIVPRIETTLRGRDVYVFVSTITNGNYNSNEPLMRALTIGDACLRANADNITLVMPHMPYQRQDRRSNDKGNGAYFREPISARLVINLLHTAGYNRIITIDPHFSQFEGFLPNGMHAEIPTARVALTSYLRQLIPQEKPALFFSPDFGGGERSEIAAKDIDALFGGLCRKRRVKAGEIKDLTVYQEEGIKLQDSNTAILYDDLADSCGTVIKCAKAIREKGIQKVIAVATHPVFSEGAIERLKEADLEMVVSNTIPLAQIPNHIHVVDISTILAVTLHCITTGHGSLSRDIFDPKRYQALETKLK